MFSLFFQFIGRLEGILSVFCSVVIVIFLVTFVVRVLRFILDLIPFM